jgi:hypothetical protein
MAGLAELVRTDAESGNRAALADNLPGILRLRKPSRAILEEMLLHLDQPADAPLRDQIRTALTRASATPAPGYGRCLAAPGFGLLSMAS